MQDLRLAVWTPLPPQRSGVAAHNAALLPLLARHAEVTAVVEDSMAGRTPPPQGVRLITQGEFRARASSFDLCIFHIGNHIKFHRYAYEEAVQTPGVVVLHDTSLVDYFKSQGTAVFDRQVRAEYGTRQITFPENGAAPVLVRELVETSRAVVVHNSAAETELRRRHATTLVRNIPLAVPPPVAPDRARLCQELDLDPDAFLVVALGGMAEHKRLGLVVNAFKSLHDLRPQARLVVAGWVHQPRSLEHVEHLVEQLDIADSVRIATDVSDQDLDLCLSGDVLLDLRSNAGGEMPLTLMRAIAAGLPSVVSDLPQLRDLPESCCIRVPTGAFAATRAAVKELVNLSGDDGRLADARQHARLYAARHLDAAAAARRHLSVAAEAYALPRHRPTVRVKTRVPVTVIGDPIATTGLMEAGRSLTRELVRAGADVTFVPHTSPATRSLTRNFDELHLVPHERRHPIELWLLNLNEFMLLDEEEVRPSDGKPRHVIASWFWELPIVPTPFTRHVSRPDEIWVPTAFVQHSLAAYTTRPVHVVPPPIDVPLPPSMERSDFGLPEDALLYFANLDANSTLARKNPWGVVSAFQRAFPASRRASDVRLVIKATHLEQHDDGHDELRRLVRSVDGILLADELTRLEMNALLSLSDVYVSLHRAEGFGLGLAEAMFLGRPVIATAYSGPTDFATGANSCPVGYDIRPITTSDHRHFPHAEITYQPGIPWADPDIDQAARWMRALADDAEMRARLGRRGAETIREKYAPDVVRRTIVKHLERAWTELQATHRPIDLRTRVDDAAVVHG